MAENTEAALKICWPCAALGARAPSAARRSPVARGRRVRRRRPRPGAPRGAGPRWTPRSRATWAIGRPGSKTSRIPRSRSRRGTSSVRASAEGLLSPGQNHPGFEVSVEVAPAQGLRQPDVLALRAADATPGAGVDYLAAAAGRVRRRRPNRRTPGLLTIAIRSHGPCACVPQSLGVTFSGHRSRSWRGSSRVGLGRGSGVRRRRLAARVG